MKNYIFFSFALLLAFAGISDTLQAGTGGKIAGGILGTVAGLAVIDAIAHRDRSYYDSDADYIVGLQSENDRLRQENNRLRSETSRLYNQGYPKSGVITR